MSTVAVVSVGRASRADPCFGGRVRRDHLAAAAHGLRLAACLSVAGAVLVAVGRASAACPPRPRRVRADQLTLGADWLRDALVIIVSARAFTVPVVVRTTLDVVARVAFGII